jgi:hypothetical protein
MQSCGQTIIDVYTELSTGGLSRTARTLHLLGVRQQFQHVASQHSTRQGNAISSMRTFFASLTFRAAPEGQGLPRHNLPSPSSRNAQRASCPSHSQSDPHIHKFIHWCFPRSRYATEMYPMQSCDINTDIEFFRALKHNYTRAKGRLKWWFSFKIPVALRFVKVRHAVHILSYEV